jgi:hypothetical protein
VLTIEARVALEGIRFIGLQPARGVQALYDRLASACGPWNDRPMFEEIARTNAALQEYLAAG